MSEEEDFDHPGKKNFSRFRAGLKHIAGETFKGVSMGGLVGGGVALAIMAATFIAFPGFSLFATVASAIGLGAGVTFGGAALGVAAFAAIGAALGGAFKLIGSALNANDAIDREEDKVIARYEQMEARQERVAMLHQRRQQQEIAMERQRAELGLRPNLPQRRGREEQVLG